MSLTVVLAPMFSGKTTYMVTQCSILIDIGFKPVFITHIYENRNDNIFLHSKILNPNFSEKLPVLKIASLGNFKEDIRTYTHVFVDEFQIFKDEDNIEVIKSLIKEGKHLYVAGLKADCFNNKFGRIIDLIPLADNIVYLKSNCSVCAKEGNRVDAPFTKRITEEEYVVSVGSNDKYVPVCRKHFE